MRVADRLHDRSGLGHGVKERRLIDRQWFDAVSHAVVARRRAGLGECLDCARDSCGLGLTRINQALFGRAMHQILAAHGGAQFGQAPHEGHGARVYRRVGTGDRQAGRLHQ